MREMRFLWNSWARLPKGLTIFIIISTLAAQVSPFVFHEQLGDEDYMFPKCFLFFGMMIFVCVFAIAVSGDLSSRFARSLPTARALYTRCVPLVIVMSAGVQTLIMCVYFVFLGAKGAEITQYSDTLIIGAIVCFSLMVFMPVFFLIPMGGLLGLYVTDAPIILVMQLLDKNVKMNGFNVPLPLAVGIYVGAFAVGTAWAFFISKARFGKTKLAANTVYSCIGK